jgi:hypothetical protein
MRRLFWSHDRLGGAGKAGFLLAVLGLVSLIFLSSPRLSQAQCEPPPVAIAGFTAAFNATLLLLINMFTASAICPGPPPACGILANTYAISFAATQNILILALETMETAILNKLDEFWENWFNALKDMTAQLSGSLSDGTRHLNSMFDASDETQKERALQETEHKAKKQYQPTNQSCRFDTVAMPMASTMYTGKYVSQGMTKDLNIQGNNKQNTPSAQGMAPVDKSRWGIYVANFCDGVSNGGYPGCTAAGSAPNADTQPGKTLFGKETIDLTVPANQVAVQALVYNLTGYEVPDPVPLNVLKTPGGKQQRARMREYLAQMDAASALVTSLVGERTPMTSTLNGAQSGANDPRAKVQQLRTKMGITDASPYPSERELRQVVVEQLWDPNYWVELGDSPSTISQKEVYLQAYNLLMLYKIIEKTEKISNAFAVQTANMLEAQYGYVKSRGTDAAPAR